MSHRGVREELALQALRLRSLVVATLCGILLSLATGLVENPPEASVIGSRYYGYPLAWRVTRTLQPADLNLINLAVDALLWFVISLLAVIILDKILSRI